MSHESEHSESEFYYPGELSHAELTGNYFISGQLLQNFKRKEKNLTILANEEAPTFSEANKQTSGQGNNFSG